MAYYIKTLHDMLKLVIQSKCQRQLSNILILWFYKAVSTPYWFLQCSNTPLPVFWGHRLSVMQPWPRNIRFSRVYYPQRCFEKWWVQWGTRYMAYGRVKKCHSLPSPLLYTGFYSVGPLVLKSKGEHIE
jgi:hypothetical protein